MVNERGSGVRDAERFRQIVEMAPNALIMVDRDGRIALVNAQTESLFGYSDGELIGKPIEVLVPARLRAAHPGFRRLFAAQPLARPMGAGRDLRAVRRDGSEFPVEIGLNPVDTDEGPMVLGSIVDITARKRAEERLRLVIEAAPNAMLMVARDGRVVLVNNQAVALFGYPREELLGLPVERLVPARYRGAHAGTRARFFEAPVTRAMGAGRDLYGLRQDGTEVPIEIGLNPIRTDEDEEFVLASIIDITERKRAERRIEVALAEKTALLKEIHHRVKNNLQVISSLLSLQASHSADAAARTGLAEAQNRVKAMAMIHQLLYERGDLSRIDLRDYLERLGDLLAKTHGADPARLRLVVEAPGASFRLDLHRAVPCGLIVVELVSNAFKHAFPDGRRGRVGVALAVEDGGGAMLAVEDDGVGMPGDELPSRGHSLGLQLVPLLAEQMRATLRRAPAAGTRVELRFPLDVPEEARP